MLLPHKEVITHSARQEKRVHFLSWLQQGRSTSLYPPSRATERMSLSLSKGRNTHQPIHSSTQQILTELFTTQWSQTENKVNKNKSDSHLRELLTSAQSAPLHVSANGAHQCLRTWDVTLQALERSGKYLTDNRTPGISRYRAMKEV